MRTHLGERGATDTLLIPFIVLALLFIGVTGFAYWAFNGRQDYKNNVDAKIAAAVATNTQSVQAQDAKQYAAEAKNPLKTYTGPDAYGSVRVEYPKTWSAYIDTTNSSTPLDAYFHNDYVPSTDSQQTYNLRVQVNSQPYSTVLNQYSGLITGGQVTAAPYSFPRVPSVVGTILTGNVLQSNPNATGVMILIPLRSTTLMVWTESSAYVSDFDAYILPNLSFSP